METGKFAENPKLSHIYDSGEPTWWNMQITRMLKSKYYKDQSVNDVYNLSTKTASFPKQDPEIHTSSKHPVVPFKSH